MASFDYFPTAESVNISYRCEKCGTENKTGDLPVPLPDYMAERADDSERSEYYDDTCSHCGNIQEIILMTRYDGGWGELTDLSDENFLNVKEEFPDDDYYIPEDFIEQTNQYTALLDKVINLTPEEEKQICQLLFVNLIARMEAFLGDTLKRLVLEDEESMRNFVKKYEDFGNVSFRLSDLFKKYDSIKEIIQEELNGKLYHNLSKVYKMYSTILGIDIKPIDKLNRAVLKRHDIVHRNGKTLDDREVIITREDVEKLGEEVTSLINRINTQILLNSL